MPLSIAERVASLIGEVTKVELESEGSFLSLGRLFPFIASEMDRSYRDSSAALGEFASITSGSSESNLRKIESFARESSAYFATIHEKDAAFLARINESINRLSSLEDVIGRVRTDSEEMEIISLNAMTVALKSGNAGKAFSVITDELKRLSSRTIALTETITERGRDLMTCFSSLRDSLGELDRFQGSFFGKLDASLNLGFSGLQSDIKAAVANFGSLLEEARAVREPVQAIMQGIQLQDILRQSLQHVSISLKEAHAAACDAEGIALGGAFGEGGTPGEGGTLGVAGGAFGEATTAGGSAEAVDAMGGIDRDEEMAFVAAIAELANSLLEDIVEKIDAGGASFGLHIGSVKSIVEGVETKRREFVGGLADRCVDKDADAATYTKGSATYLGLKKSVIQTAGRLSDQVKGLDESFRGLAGLLTRFQNIVIASRIEVAKNRALAGVTTTVQGMVELTERISADVGEAMGTTKDFIKVAFSAIVEYSGSGEPRRRHRAEGGAGEDADRLQATLSRVESEILLLDSERDKLGCAIGSFLLYTPEFISLIAEARSQLQVIEHYALRLRDIKADLASLQAELGTIVMPGTALASIKSERLRAMIDRFTIFTHKKTAGDIGRFNVEDGVEAGEVTLF